MAKKTTKKAAKKTTKKVASKTTTKKAVSAKKKVSGGRKIKVGVFGGTFNPIHYGHLNSVETVRERLALKKVILVPNYQNPLREKVEGPTPEERMEMVQLMLPQLNQNGEYFEVSNVEVKRKSPSYTIETLVDLQKQIPGADLHLIIGMDQLPQFDQWKDFDKILRCAQLVVTSRPGSDFPLMKEDLPTWLVDRLKSFRNGKGTLKSGKKVVFVELTDMDISGTEIRQRLRRGGDVSKYTPTMIADYVNEHGIYNRLGAKVQDYGKFTEFCASILKEKGGLNVVGFDLREMEQPAEYSLVSSGTSSRHTAALAEYVSKAVRDEFGVYPQAREGVQEARWIVLDYGQLIIHLFYDYVRNEYRLEDLWRDGRRMEL